MYSLQVECKRNEISLREETLTLIHRKLNFSSKFDNEVTFLWIRIITPVELKNDLPRIFFPRVGSRRHLSLNNLFMLKLSDSNFYLLPFYLVNFQVYQNDTIVLSQR